MNRKPITLTVINHVKPPAGRNDRCVCGSGKKFKACCWKTRQTSLLHSINAMRDAEQSARVAPSKRANGKSLVAQV